MKILNLGRVVVLLFMAVCLNANVSATLNKSRVYSGDAVSLTITAIGENPKFPEISEIGGDRVVGVGDETNLNITNGKKVTKNSKIYTFYPTKSMEIPSFKVEVDGEIFATKPLSLEVVEPAASKMGDEYVLELKGDKTTIFVGESVKFSLVFKRRLDALMDDFRYELPRINSLLVEPLEISQGRVDGEYVVFEISFLVTPSRVGEFRFSPLTALVGVADRRSFFGSINYQKVFSNPLDISVLALPDGAEIFGEFAMSGSVDKNTTLANEPVNFTLKISGVGNVDAIKNFNLEKSGMVVYKSEPVIKTGLVEMGESSGYGGEFEQKFAILSDRNFTIPSFSFEYFSKDKNRSVVLKTKPISVEVINQSLDESVKSPKPSARSDSKNLESKSQEFSENSTQNSILWIGVSLIAGILIGAVLVTLMRSEPKKADKKDSPLKARIKRAKDDKTLFKVLLPYAKKSEYLDEILRKLEENIYKNGNFRIDKKELLEFVENFERDLELE